MTDIRSALADEIRRRARGERDSAERDERSALNRRDLAAVLDGVAAKLDRGEVDDKVNELLAAARPSIFWELNRYGDSESEIDRLRRIFGLDGAQLAVAIGKLP